MTPPFVYVAALRRTGSTVLSEALTGLPHSFVFREPRLGEGRFAVKDADQELFLQHGIDLRGARDRWSRPGGPGPLVGFARELLPELQRVSAQVGVKEIRNGSWRALAEHLSPLRVLLTGRDPRDIYLSLADRVAAGRAGWRGELTPERLAAHLDEEHSHQRDLAAELPTLRVPYERLCTDPGMLDEVRAFVSSPLPAPGRIGALNASNPQRQGEAALHDGRLTDRRVRRWEREPDPDRAAQADRVRRLLPRYCDEWGYA